MAILASDGRTCSRAKQDAYLDRLFVTRFLPGEGCCTDAGCSVGDWDDPDLAAPSSDLTLDGDDASSTSLVCLTSSQIESNEFSCESIGNSVSTGE